MLQCICLCYNVYVYDIYVAGHILNHFSRDTHFMDDLLPIVANDFFRVSLFLALILEA